MNTNGNGKIRSLRFLSMILILTLILPSVLGYSWGIKTAPPQVFNNQTNLTINDIMLHGELCFYNDGCINNITGVENGTIRLENYVPYVGANKTLQMGIENITFDDGRLLVRSSLPDALNPMIFVNNNNTNGTSFARYENDVGGQIDIGIFGYEVGQELFPTQVNVSHSAMGITTRGGPIWFGTRDNDAILFGGSPDDNLSNINFSVKIDTEIDALVFQGDKYIVPKLADGGHALVFDSEDILEAGGFPFLFEARDSLNDTIILSWQQNGANNSYSGQMNSFGVVPKSWILNTSPGMDTNNVTFLFNTSNYIKYCNWLQTNLSLVSEGCQYFADTAGRDVPLMFAGDFEVHRTATIHEALTVFNDFDFIGRSGNDADFLFNGGSGGKIHGRDPRVVLANFTSLDRLLCNFDDATLCDFVVESIAPEVGRDWDSVLEAQCHQDRCANAKGGNDKIMSLSEGTQNGDNINVSFWLTSVLSVGDLFYITLDDNLGNVTTIYSTAAVINDELQSFIMPDIYENKTNITTSFILAGQNINREVWVDDVRVTANFTDPIEINDPYEGGRMILGEDRGNLSCAVDVNKRANNQTFGTEWFMSLGSPDCTVEFVGNVTFTDSTVINQTVIGDQIITGNLSVGGDISQNGVLLDDTYVPYTGATTDLDMGSNDIITASDMFLTGSATQTLNIGDEIVANLYELEMGVSGTLSKIETYSASGLNIRASYPSSNLIFSAAGDLYLTPDGDVEMGSSDVTTTGVVSSSQGVFGANTLLGLSDGDINVSTVYYDTLTAKSPVFMCSDDWCSVSFPKYQKTLWLQVDDSWNIVDVVYEGNHYTKSEFNSQVCSINQNTQEICARLNSKVSKLQDKKSCENSGNLWDGSCYSIVQESKTYGQAVHSYFDDVSYQEEYVCSKLDDALQVVEEVCIRSINSGTVTRYAFNDGCGWTEEYGYYCEEKVLVE